MEHKKKHMTIRPGHGDDYNPVVPGLKHGGECSGGKMHSHVDEHHHEGLHHAMEHLEKEHPHHYGKVSHPHDGHPKR